MRYTATPFKGWTHGKHVKRDTAYPLPADSDLEHAAFAPLALGDTTIATVVHRLQRAAKSNLPILLHGETGTGKELFARAIHAASARCNGPFVALNCASIPEGLIESELFGHRAGAFTGASTRGARGLIQQANGGTLFLDEIGDMPLAMQSRLLRVLAEKEVTPVGADTPIKTDFRIISATHRDLQERAARHAFREDLLFRLHGLAVTLPPLRTRTDIGELARRLLAAEQTVIGRRLTLEPCANRLIARLRWPGNVRQLRQVLTTAAWLSDAPGIRAIDIETALESGITDMMAGPANAGHDAPRHTVGNAAPEDARSLLLLSLRRNRWNVSSTAREFNTARTTIYRRMARFGIVQPNLLDS
ncbi:sigma-54-dependent Fis family transcriptional regulator [Denitromonas ohlonensis]|uniref:Sigma-54-dependent Fis family transcriptional regulator n=2 Tax=Denitromonas TaxID=139331 RepID=A0A557SQR0_9RHOO|nr:sigma 54-interacting transcriptional regulator [Denitromonas ohlonensis]TVO66891.1 sigma-54-dependent Fis family transcriptional regulator [Denitromonas ohlonensis]TVO79761.1 sigma-54-dependent Fis family transcriptional regulator [Denitromonas ohlonensis]